MKKITIPDYKKLSRNLTDEIKKIIWFFAKDAFLSIMVLITLAVVIGEFLFYNYLLVPQIRDPEPGFEIIKFKEDSYNSAIREWGAREEIFNNPLKSNYQNPFTN